MVDVGYAFSSEEHHPNDLVKHARLAEEAGFRFGLISDHFHPWVSSQGHSPFVWSVIGGIAQATERFRLGTGVTCPTVRIHPAIIAQAAGTAAAMMPGRFFLGVGTGENLNEHILGDRWPEWEVRASMLQEAVEVIRLLWQGGNRSHHGRHYTVENARLYTLPDEPTPIIVAAGGPRSAELAGRIGDGLCATTANSSIVQGFEQAGGSGKPRYAQMTVCWAPDEASARQTAYELWAYSALPGELSQELPTPAHFEQAVQIVTEEQVAEAITCGPDRQRHLAKLQEYVDAGFDHVYVHQVGPDQEGFLDFYAREILPEFR
ncbi:MAG TPA: TIGR03557 family F420-dependent LLM class oxidoreductase [Thermomicrobiales bacterium]|nr:TIGR03557 family F420-dependent LLM class oxidoreductase [Thermomicrobiales bacterium]